MWTHDVRVALNPHDRLYAFPVYKFLKTPEQVGYAEQNLAAELAAVDNLLQSFWSKSSATLRGIVGLEVPWDGRRAPGYCTEYETLTAPRGGMPVIVADHRDQVENLSITWLTQYREGIARRLERAA